MAGVWENFDRWADAAVRREVSFATFVRNSDADFARLARLCARHKHPPSWVDLNDIKSELVALAWHYLFERKCQNGSVGFNESMYRSAGAYARWKIRTKMGKILSKAKGEHQHRRTGSGRPEYLSKTGELPESTDEISVERIAERSIEVSKLSRLCETAKEFAIVRAMAQGMGDERRVVSYLMNNGFEHAAEARSAVDDLVVRLEKKVRAEARA